MREGRDRKLGAWCWCWCSAAVDSEAARPRPYLYCLLYWGGMGIKADGKAGCRCRLEVERWLCPGATGLLSPAPVHRSWRGLPGRPDAQTLCRRRSAPPPKTLQCVCALVLWLMH